MGKGTAERPCRIEFHTTQDIKDKFYLATQLEGVSVIEMGHRLLASFVDNAPRMNLPTTMDAEIERQVQERVLTRNKAWAEEELQLFADAARIRNAHRGIMSLAQFRDLLKLIHPDVLDGIAASGKVPPDVRDKAEALIDVLSKNRATIVTHDKVSTDGVNLAAILKGKRPRKQGANHA